MNWKQSTFIVKSDEGIWFYNNPVGLAMAAILLAISKSRQNCEERNNTSEGISRQNMKLEKIPLLREKNLTYAIMKLVRVKEGIVVRIEVRSSSGSLKSRHR